MSTWTATPACGTPNLHEAPLLGTAVFYWLSRYQRDLSHVVPKVCFQVESLGRYLHRGSWKTIPAISEWCLTSYSCRAGPHRNSTTKTGSTELTLAWKSLRSTIGTGVFRTAPLWSTELHLRKLLWALCVSNLHWHMVPRRQRHCPKIDGQQLLEYQADIRWTEKQLSNGASRWVAPATCSHMGFFHLPPVPIPFPLPSVDQDINGWKKCW